MGIRDGHSCGNCYFFLRNGGNAGICARREPTAPGNWPTVSSSDWCGRWSDIAVRDPSVGPTGPNGNGFDPYTTIFYDKAQTNGNQSSVVRSIPIDLNSVVLLQIQAGLLNSTGDKGGTILLQGSATRGVADVFIPNPFSNNDMCSIPSVAVNAIVNALTQSIDVTISGAVAAGLVSWFVRTLVQKSF